MGHLYVLGGMPWEGSSHKMDGYKSLVQAHLLSLSALWLFVWSFLHKGFTTANKQLNQQGCLILDYEPPKM